MRSEFDAIVIGAGPAGSTGALALAQQGWSVAVVERSSFPRRKVCGEFISATNMALLDQLGVGTAFRGEAGPEIGHVGLFAGESCIASAMPRDLAGGYGRALGRDRLDTLLLDEARSAGVTVFQPWRATALVREGGLQALTIMAGDQAMTLRAPVIIAAHGSWEPGPLPSQVAKQNTPSDLLGFKAHFSDASLPSDLMPLLAFPGGYGGLVQADQGRLSLSCCVRRDVLAVLRRATPGLSAAEVVQAHIVSSCRGARLALRHATLDGPWLAAGPIRPGIRARYGSDIFRVGNAAGESHPIIAEGISMAMQSAWLLARELLRADSRAEAGRALAGQRYAAAWRRQFATRIYVAGALAQLAVRPAGARVMRGVAAGFPALLGWGARLSGKTREVRGLG